MPPPRDPDNLIWTTLSDFRGGLWDRGNLREVPANGLLELVDAIPTPIGGLRAGFRWSTEANSSAAGSSKGLAASGQVLLGYNLFHFPHNLLPRVRHMVAIASTVLASTVNVWQSESTSSTTLDANFALLSTHSSVSAYWPMRFLLFAHSTLGSVAVEQFWHVADQVVAGTTGGGIFKRSDAGAVVQLSSGSVWHLEAHQARLLSVFRVGGRWRQELHFSNDGTDNNSSASSNSFQLAASRPSDIACMYATIPADLAVLKSQVGWFKVGGAISAEPVVYEASRVHPSQELSFATETPAGLAYLTRDEGVWAFTGGREPTHLSRQIAGTPMTEPALRGEVSSTAQGPQFLGQPAYAGTYLFTPKGYVHDFRTNGWHRISELDSSPAWLWLQFDELEGRLWAARHTQDGGIQIRSMSIDERDSPRLSTYMFTTPLQYLDGRRVVVRELEYHLQTYSTGSQLVVDVIYRTAAGAESTVTLPTVTIPSTGNVQVRVQTGRPGSINTQLFRVRTHLSAPGTGEAPTLEKMRIGVVQADARIEVS